MQIRYRDIHPYFHRTSIQKKQENDSGYYSEEEPGGKVLGQSRGQFRDIHFLIVLYNFYICDI